MIRVLVDRDGGLRDGEAHHLQVRRVETGETVEVRDGEGLVARGTLRRIGKVWSVEVGTSERVAPPTPLVLAVGAGDRDRFAWVVEKATELGVTSVVPLESERTAGVATRVRRHHLGRLRRHAMEAVKQSGAAWAARVEEPVELREIEHDAPRSPSHSMYSSHGSPTVRAGSPMWMAGSRHQRCPTNR